MRLLLDENIPRRLKSHLIEHEVYTVNDLGWSGISNGLLLRRLVEKKFDALVTFDKNLQHQQNLSVYTLPVIVLHAPDNSYKTLESLVPAIKEVLKQKLKPGPTIVRHL